MVSLIVSLLLLGFCIVVLFYLYQGPLYVPTHKKAVSQMVEAANIKPGMRVADLGSGDGRIVVAMGQAGAMCVGFEINPVLVWYSRWKIRKLGLQDRIEIRTSDFWRQDLSGYDVVIVFGISHVMNRLAEKLKKELKPGSTVISNAFSLPGMQESEKLGSLLVYRL